MVTLATSEGFLGGYSGTSRSVSVSVIAGAQRVCLISLKQHRIQCQASA